MNEEITNTAAEAFVAIPVAKLTDAEVEALLASKPESAPVAVAETDEAPTVH